MSDARLIYILSDSTGDTASRVVRAAMKQFVGEGVEIRRHPNVLRKSELRAILAEAAETHSLVAHTFAAAPLRRVDADPSGRTAEGDVDHRTLPTHPAREGAQLAAVW